MSEANGGGVLMAVEGPSTSFAGPPPRASSGRNKTHKTPAGETSPASVHPWALPSMYVR